jgi:RNA 3'-terminal phosphate cyclase-like protein
MLRFEGSKSFRYRLIASVLSGKKLRIDKIRNEDESPGLQEFEASFLRLLEKISDGSKL